jgi:alpha-N-arabinofuranosidase
MRPEYYADLYLRYQTYVRHLSGNRVFKIACGPNGGDLRWTEVLMREAARQMAGLALHYYPGPGGSAGATSRSATVFGEAEWVATVRNALRMEDLIERHAEIMDRYDPEGRVALVVDEWGTWYDTEADAPPGYVLYQQNTLRDAVVAGVTLNIFNRHANRVRMANLAQTVNVLQAVILTRGAEMILTPTYHVFDMFRVHQDAQLVPTRVHAEEYGAAGERVPVLHASASRDGDGRVHLSLCNTNPGEGIRVHCTLGGLALTTATGRVLTGDRPDAHNTFSSPESVCPQPLDGLTLDGGALAVTLPPASVAVLELA